MKEITMRPLLDSDIVLMKMWLKKDYIRRWYNEPEAWLYEMKERHRGFSFIKHFIVIYDNIPIGFCQYYTCADSNEKEYRAFPKVGTYSIDYLIGDETFLGKGFGKGIVRKLINMVFALQDSKLIVVKPEPENIASCNTLIANGFVYDENHNVYKRQKF